MRALALVTALSMMAAPANPISAARIINGAIAVARTIPISIAIVVAVAVGIVVAYAVTIRIHIARAPWVKARSHTGVIAHAIPVSVEEMMGRDAFDDPSTCIRHAAHGFDASLQTAEGSQGVCHGDSWVSNKSRRRTRCSEGNGRDS